MTDFIRIRHCEGGETVTDGKARTACSYCSNGVCRQMEACVPEARRSCADGCNGCEECTDYDNTTTGA